ncbi:hypothetical protein BD413DRAFT_558742 [Trametes elegans]|nr:hypothetical protein BD413DRAFT_558742 [Trametes elegans]
MGQANSRSSTSPSPPVSRPQLSHSSSSPSQPSSSQSSQRDVLDPSEASLPSSTKAARRSVRRSVRSFLRPRTLSDSPSPSPSTSDQIPSIRKRWRSSRRFSKAPSSLPNLSEALQDSDSRRPSPPAAAVDAQVLAPSADTLVSSGPATAAATLFSPVSHPITSHISLAELPAHAEDDAEALYADDHHSSQDHLPHEDVQVVQRQSLAPDVTKRDITLPPPDHADRAHEIEREINDFLLERPRQDSLFVEGSSQDGQSSPEPQPSLLFSSGPEPPMDVDGVPSDPSPQAARHFPPPGTLVVVQGVVNTSDNPSSTQPSASASSGVRPAYPTSLANPTPPQAAPLRRSSSVPRSTGPPEERQSTSATPRNRLSSFIPRPSSMLRRRSSTSEPSAAVPFRHSSRSSSDVSSEAFESTVSDSSEDVSDPASETASPEQPSGDEGEGHARPLSPGSIDVLGTLLSVAAAATAASLFSPSLGFQANSGSTPSPQPAPAIPRPMSPTPTAGLGGGPGFSVVPDFDSATPAAAPAAAAPAPQQREGRERIRNVWESFRERLGLNRSGTSQAGGAAPPGTDDPANMRPGEIMLAEMARALNAGLGLTGDGLSALGGDAAGERAEGLSAHGEGARSVDAAASSRPPPPEDSFERFLLNLQADLRVALSESGVGSAAPPPPVDVHGDDREDEEHRVSEEGSTSPTPAHDRDRASSAMDEDEDVLPPLQDASDSEEDEGEDGEDYEPSALAEDQTSARTATPMPSVRDLPSRNSQASPSSSGASARTQDEDRRPPGIHLWRLYRFQPIHATQIAGHAAATPSAAPPMFPSAHTQAPSPAPTPSSPSPSPQTDGQSNALGDPPTYTSSSPSSSYSPLPLPPHLHPPATQPAGTAPAPAEDGAEPPSSALPASDANANMVVPVIVVGLQSVEMGQVHGHAHPPHDAPGTGTTPTADYPDAPNDERAWPAPSPSASTAADEGRRENGGGGGGRTWQSRAASALRNLRPGRRGGPGGQQAAEGTGSRTFLIYVIGGYYPPNHHMVTGPDNLDSYEALWELAELLGQVKPQVATREDIDKSDLQIVKFSELARYEREGRVASNCLDRCWICLDSYQPEDELRLMHCKHTFHKDCVDKWMQVGRNNCPACRARGVSTSDEVIPQV